LATSKSGTLLLVANRLGLLGHGGLLSNSPCLGDGYTKGQGRDVCSGAVLESPLYSTLGLLELLACNHIPFLPYGSILEVNPNKLEISLRSGSILIQLNNWISLLLPSLLRHSTVIESWEHRIQT